MGKALITWGGWDGHEPDRVAALFAGWLREAGMEVQVTDSLSSFDDAQALAAVDLIVPVWTMSQIGKEQALNACAAVRRARVLRAVTAACAMPSATTWTGSS